MATDPNTQAVVTPDAWLYESSLQIIKTTEPRVDLKAAGYAETPLFYRNGAAHTTPPADAETGGATVALLCETVSELRTRLAEAEAREARLREALSRIGNSAPNHCVCCTHMGHTARSVLTDAPAKEGFDAD